MIGQIVHDFNDVANGNCMALFPWQYQKVLSWQQSVVQCGVVETPLFFTSESQLHVIKFIPTQNTSFGSAVEALNWLYI
jgi:hypothetical protein